MKKKVSPHQARSFLIAYQGLTGPSAWEGTKGILQFLEKVGSIQYDPLNVVGRNPDLVLQSRISNYTPSMLTQLLYTDRTLVDGWDKMMSIYRTSEWPLFTRVRNFREEAALGSLRYRKSLKALEYCDAALDRISKDGPLRSTQLDFGRAAKNRWGHGKISSAVLDYLFHRGDLCVASRTGVQKHYDISERLLGEITKEKDPFNTDRNFYSWLVKRRINAAGLFWNKSGVVWQGIDSKLNTKSYRQELLDGLVASGELYEYEVEGISSPFYSSCVLSEDYEIPGAEIKILAPLDNLIWDRKMIEALFGFSYTWEVYTPAHKRKYGYYVLPVLLGTDFIARIEPVIDETEKILIIKNWWWEETAHNRKKYSRAIDRGLKKFTLYLGLKSWRNDSTTDFL